MKVPLNVGKWDAFTRVLIGGTAFWCFFIVPRDHAWLFLLAAFLLLSGLVRTCPVYAALGCSTASNRVAREEALKRDPKG